MQFLGGQFADWGARIVRPKAAKNASPFFTFKKSGMFMNEKQYEFFFLKLDNHPMTVLIWYISKSVFSSFSVSTVHNFLVDIFKCVNTIFRVGISWFQKHIFVIVHIM